MSAIPIGAPDDNNLVDIARKLKINIPAPCLKNQRKEGCCKACLVLVNGKATYACSTRPKSGIIVVVRRDDLDKIRKDSIKKFKKHVKSGSRSQFS
ncbi:2Fe-2S iron-sulfur cluster-binding protein [Vibrio pectenicida]|uniref:2Fe-2S iron-sulfur cluster binding domain-containing protein n=1 Tax=Vibrio pectenicida TaxID=62763 RepID=A0A3R9L1G6_9VIBR|nr:2Fe-2S iron-sulfur cluster-binding protein [Vibrio pectenicida]RSD30856.1 2Fe-2S iron-sulfur cluster binding domain-containing protein [Vibrio pectenicida]